MLIYLARHGETDANKERRIQGSLLDPPLNGTGRLQAARLAERLAEIATLDQIHAVYASPALRARSTAEPIARTLCLPRVGLAPGLREASWGNWDGSLVTPEREAEIRSIFSRWREGDLLARAPDGESASDIITRASATMRTLVRLHAGESIVIVGHERCNKLLLSHLLHGEPSRMEDWAQPHGGVTLLHGASGRWRCEPLPPSLSRADSNCARLIS